MHTAHDHNSQLKIETLRKHQSLEHFVRHFRMMWTDDKPLLEKTFSTGWAGRNSKNSLEQVSKGHKFHLDTNVCKLSVSAK